MENRGYITVNNNCIGCGRCMLECPADETNISVYNMGQRRLRIDPANCISCGNCMEVCNHGARDYHDDTDAFLDALKAGEKVSLIVSTSLYMTYGSRTPNILGYLRSLGVNKIYDSGFGADIFVYLNARFVKEYSGDTQKRPFIMNSCPTVLNYIQRYEPDVVDYIIPVQSPPLCTAIFVQKYLGDDSKLAYLSSCVSRREEFDLASSGNRIAYSVTFDHLMKRIGEVDMSGCSAEPELIAPGSGNIICASGGLRNYMASLFSEDEIITSYNKLDGRTKALLASTTSEGIKHPLMVSIVGCEYGCTHGAGGDPKHRDDLRTYIAILQSMRQESMIKKREHASYWDIYRALGETFADIDPKDFTADLKDSFIQLHKVPDNIINDIFNRMNMVTPESRSVDCRACGYRTCREMASAVAKGHARIEDCARYVNNEFKKKLFFDDLTGILTAQGFHSEASMMLQMNRDKKYVVCTGNINGIKTINDLYSFNSGSQVLIYIARYLAKVVEGRGLCARLGGDNFVVCIENTPENLHRLMAIRYFDCGEMGVSMRVTMRFGLCEQGGMSDVRRITNYASLAMEKNKDKSVNSFRWFDDKLRSEIMMEASITSQMRYAMMNKEFTMYLQPQYNHSSGELVGAESLCRWIKQDGSMVSPGLFIPIFEKNGYIKVLDKYMWEEAFKLLKNWSDEGVTAVPVSVNISRMSLVDDEIIDVISKLKDKYMIDEQLLHFEITESAYSEDQEALIRRISAIRDMGFRIAMDDFGSGYSSLNTLKDIPIDILKLDMGFLRGESNSKKGGNIIGAVIRMAHNLGLLTVAEGVETVVQADFLKSVGCDVIQGYLYARPMPVGNFEELLAGSRKTDVHKDTPSIEEGFIDIFEHSSEETRYFENFVGPAAVFDYNSGKVGVIRVNDRMIDVLGYRGRTSVEFSEGFYNRVVDKDRHSVVETIDRAIKGEKGAVCIFGYTRPDDVKIILRTRLWYVGMNGENPSFYTLTEDVTDVMDYKKE